MSRILSLATIWLVCLTARANEPDRFFNYAEAAVAVIIDTPEVIERDGRKYRVLLQDLETEKIKPKIKSTNGSGFFLNHKEQLYFVTAQHVAKRLPINARLGFLSPDGQSRQFVLGKLVGNKDNFVWKHHEETDVSVLKLHLPEKGIEEVAPIAISSDKFYLKKPPRTSRLIVTGFPGGLGTRGGKISPITSVVHLASSEIHLGVVLENIPVKTAWLINPPAGKGFSGGPIFYQLPDGNYRCVGILNGAWSDPTGGKFSISVPAKYIFDLLEAD